MFYKLLYMAEACVHNIVAILPINFVNNRIQGCMHVSVLFGTVNLRLHLQ
jgi:hypothetical protein